MPEPTRDAVRLIAATTLDLQEIANAADHLLELPVEGLTRHHIDLFLSFVESRLAALKGDWL